MKIIKEYKKFKLNENFWKWFGNSKVVDNNGDPLICYHSTNKDFDNFENKELGYHFGTIMSAHNRLKFKFKDQQLINESIIPVYLKIENPIYMDDIGIWDDIDEIVSELINVNILDNNTEFIEKYYDMLKLPIHKQDKIKNKILDDIIQLLTDTLKYDGIIYNNISEDVGEQSYLVFKNTQIKSVIGNNGDYNPNDPNINK